MTIQEKHSKLGASIAKRWLNCPGSVHLIEKYNLTSSASVYAATGTLLHKLTESGLVTNRPFNRQNHIGQTHKVEGFEITITDEMLDAVELCINCVHSIESQLGKLNYKREVEKRIELTNDLYGTVDTYIHSLKHNETYVIDFKFGKGVVVNPKDNYQLMYYALGILQSITGSVINLPDDHKVHLCIIQPFLKQTMDIHTISIDELMNFKRLLYLGVLDVNKAKNNPESFLKCGEWCKFCPASAICPQQTKEIDDLLSVDLTLVEIEPTPEAKELIQQECAIFGIPDETEPQPGGAYLQTLLDKLPLVEAWVSSVRNYAHKIALTSEIPGYKLVPKRATRKWAMSEQEIVDYLSLLVLSDNLFEKKLKSPAQIEKLVGKDFLTDLIKQESSGMNLVKIKENSLNDLENEFSSLEI
jgi:hypothetical protein